MTIGPAVTRGIKKAGRTLVQMLASGGLTALINAMAHGMSPTVQLMVAALNLFLVTFGQNAAETKGLIPTLLPTVGLVTTGSAGGLVTKTVGTVDTTVGTVGGVVTDVVNTAGKVVGGMVGTLDRGGELGGGSGGGSGGSDNPDDKGGI